MEKIGTRIKSVRVIIIIANVQVFAMDQTLLSILHPLTHLISMITLLVKDNIF